MRLRPAKRNPKKRSLRDTKATLGNQRAGSPDWRPLPLTSISSNSSQARSHDVISFLRRELKSQKVPCFHGDNLLRLRRGPALGLGLRGRGRDAPVGVRDQQRSPLLGSFVTLCHAEPAKEPQRFVGKRTSVDLKEHSGFSRRTFGCLVL